MSISLADRTIVKRLIAIGSDSLCYEGTGVSAGTLVKLDNSDGDIDTSNYLEMCEAYQKVFIVNGTNLKVADFVNIKITTDDILPADKTIPLKGDILTGGTSEAKMVVDFITATDGACSIYGYRTTDETFADTETVTGTNDNGDISFELNANETSGPLWYDWTVYSGDTTNYGTLPEQAYLIALYRGRVVVSGDFQHPHQWWMSKIGDPWNYNTAGTDTIDAVTHTNSDVGEIGDIVTALIPYKDDFLIFGCANSIWVMVGDPRAQGQLAEMSLTTGIWGSRSWCFDSNNNFYFLGNNGIYKVAVSESFGAPENISQLALPNFIADWDLDKSLHRVSMAFDPARNGILICKTTLADGTNSNYFYSLTTGGFYPETYPKECAAYSLFYYPANDDTYKNLLVGCTDGYIREFLDSEKDDDIGDTNEAISSYVVLPIKLIAENEDKEGKLLWLNGVTAGGASGGDFLDSDSVDWSIYVGDDAETVLEDIKDGAIAFATGSWDGTGKQNKSRVKARGSYLGIKLANSTEDETWAINKVFGEIKSVGRLK